MRGGWGSGGEVLDVAGKTGADSPQVTMAVERIRRDDTVTAMYGFSGGGYNARAIWKELTAAERERIRNIIVVGSPPVAKADFPGSSDVLIKADPPEGHMAGPKVLLESLDQERRPGVDDRPLPQPRGLLDTTCPQGPSVP